MENIFKHQFKSRFNVAPCDYIRRELEFRCWKQNQLGKKLGVSQEEIDSIMKKEKPITENMAERLELLFGESKTFWLTIDEMYWGRYKKEKNNNTKKAVD